MRSINILVGDPFLSASLALPFRRAVGSDRVLRCWDGPAILEFVSSTGRYRFDLATGGLQLIVMHAALPVIEPNEVTRRIRATPSVREVPIVIVGERQPASDVLAERVDRLDDDVVLDLVARANIEPIPATSLPRGASPEALEELKRIRRLEASRRGGLKGGRVRAQRLSPERRAEIARLGARARWARANAEDTSSLTRRRTGVG